MAILDELTVDFISSSAEQTVRLGVRLGQILKARDVICLSGNLGSGKTTIAQGIGRGWGTGLHVTSPTFTLVNEYPRSSDGRILYHVDCYRLEDPNDIYTAGLEDIFDDDGPIMIEWPERISAMLPDDRLWIELRTITDTRRGLRFKAMGSRPAELLMKFRHDAFGV
jgi:tRNA threonylcarbamoyladenosine biosynthesis protein TsaE